MDLPRERGLCDMEPVGRSAEVLLFSNANEIAEMPEFH